MAKIWKFGAHVDTDQMVPGRFAPYMRPDRDVGEAAFIEADPEFNARAAPGDVIVAGTNFGCGSSREYAPLALKRRGIAAIIAPEFARIFYRNAINLGIPLYVCGQVPNRFGGGEEIVLNLAENQLIFGSEVLHLPPLPVFARTIVAAGGMVAYYRQHGGFPNVAQS